MHHSSVSGHLGCFHVLAIVNVATMNTGVHVSFRNVVFSGYMPSSVIGESNDRFIPSFLRNLYTGFHNGCISYIPINSAGGFPFHHILSRIYCCRFFFFFWWLFWLVWVRPHCSFNLHFSINEWCSASLHVFIGHLYVFFGEMSV